MHQPVFKFGDRMRFDEALVQQIAVLRPLVKPSSAYASDATKEVPQLLSIWQVRLKELAHLWSPEVVKQMHCCRPSMVILHSGKDNFFCKRSYICPWCWARKVRAEYLRFVAKMKDAFRIDDHKVKPVDLWYINLVYPLVFRAGGIANRLCHDALIGNLHQARSALGKMSKDHNSYGGCGYAYVDLVKRKDNWCWCIRVPGMLVVPAGTAMPQIYEKLGGRIFRASRKTKIPPLRSLAYVVGKCRRYPSGLMKGPVPLAEDLLAIRSGLRMDASVGIFHGCGYLRDFTRKETIV